MEDFRTTRRLITKNCFMATLDLKDAYLLVPVNKDYWKFLRFQFNGKLYEFTCLCFGLNIAPRIFTKILRPVVGYLRSLGHESCVYLDDIFLLGRNEYSCLGNVAHTRSFLEYLGLVINYDKSNLIPSTQISYLGFVFDSVKMRMYIPELKVKKTLGMISSFLASRSLTIRQLATLLGVFISQIPAVSYGLLYTKILEFEKFRSLRQHNDNFNSKIVLSHDARQDILWWQQSLRINSGQNIFCDEFSLEIFSDASMSGWGAFCNSVSSHGLWNSSEADYSINYLELLAAFYGLRCFARSYRNCRILLRIDNTTAIAYINRYGGVQYPRLNKIARKIWQFCEFRSIHVFASYIPSKENCEADAASRNTDWETEWQLNPTIFQQILQKVSTSCRVDLFASMLNAQFDCYVSWKPDPFAWKVDAFTFSWESIKFYAFPPISLIPRVLQKIVNDKAEGLLISTSPERQNIITSRDFIRSALLTNNVPIQATDTILHSLADSTWKQYETSFKSWSKYCDLHNFNIYDITIHNTLQFLQQLYNNGQGYSSLNSARSFLSLVSTGSSGKTVGNDPLISRFMRGIGKQRPPTPRYDSTWDPEVVLTYLRTLEPLEELSLQLLSFKTIGLIALATAHRVQTFSLISTDEIFMKSTGIEINISSAVKTSKPGVLQPSLFLPFFPESQAVCVARTLGWYLQRTISLRSASSTRLFLSVNPPHNPVTSQTLSRWLKLILKHSGVNDSVYSAHSFRHSSTSAAARRGTSIDQIRRRAGWSESSSTFARHYNRPLSSQDQFARAVFNL
ncbi:unnamed protein product [Allacma fusca]|uniref:Reverse transcriptase domain-containing protein n=1 Tax=Allacma fusca TaxID=39272 RepID=A0A8J2KWK7_9HEXA|nr:unnamed protein product [Allacma fusca]